jgi:hypothetical protein
MCRLLALFVILTLVTPLVIAHPTPPAAAQDGGMRSGLVNLDHLLFLTEPVTFGDRDVAIVHIYSEYPEYEWVDAAGEGITAVDDVARAALVYLWYYDQTGDTRALDQARLCLEFVRYLQNDDGSFHNFVTDRVGTINTQGNTSYKSLGWWAMRGLWALAEGIRVFDAVDPGYAAELQEAYMLTESALAATLQNYGTTSQLHGYSIPAWIPDGAADVSGVLWYASQPRHPGHHRACCRRASCLSPGGQHHLPVWDASRHDRRARLLARLGQPPGSRAGGGWCSPGSPGLDRFRCRRGQYVYAAPVGL